MPIPWFSTTVAFDRSSHGGGDELFQAFMLTDRAVKPHVGAIQFGNQARNVIRSVPAVADR